MNPFEGYTAYEAACALREAAFSVFPLQPRSKRPAIPSWKEWQAKIPSREQMEAWDAAYPGCNWAVVCGSVSSLAVFDSDSPEAEEWRRAHVNESPVRVRTSHGWHWWFHYPEGGLGNANLRFRDGVAADVKAEGGYVVAPQSIHPDGTLYELDFMDGATDFECLPELVISSGIDLSGIRLDNVQAMHAPVPQGGRDNFLASYAGSLFAKGLDQTEVLALTKAKNAEMCVPPQPLKDVVRVVESICRTDLRNHPRKQEKPDIATDMSGLEVETPQESAEIEWPEAVLHPGGLLEELAGFISKSSIRSQPAYSLAGAVSILSTLAVQRIKGETGLVTNNYCVAVGGSGSGKDAPKQAVERILYKICPEASASDAASESAITKWLGQPGCRRSCFVLDEFGLFLKAAKIANSPRANITKTFTELFSKYSTESVHRKIYADSTKNRALVWCGLCILGLTVPEEFWGAMQDGEATNGFLARLIVFEHSGPPAPRNRDFRMDIPEDLLERLRGIWDMDGGDREAAAKPDGGVEYLVPAHPPVVQKTPEAREFHWQMTEWADSMMADAEEKGNSAAAACWNRCAEHADKLSLVHLVSRLGGQAQTGQVELADVQWGWSLARTSVGGTVKRLESFVYDSDFNRWCILVVEAISKYVKRESSHRKRDAELGKKLKPGAPRAVIEKALKGVQPRLVNEVIGKLIATNRIRLIEGWTASDKSRRPLDLYCLVREIEEDS